MELVSAGRGGVDSLWFDQQGMDLFVTKGQVVDLHLSTPRAA